MPELDAATIAVQAMLSRVAAGGLGLRAGGAAVQELRHWRTENSKVFLLDDGRAAQVIRAKPVHYRPHAGAGWEDVDTALESTTEPGFTWQMLKAPYQMFVADRVDAGPAVRVVRGGKPINYRLGALRWRTGDQVRKVADLSGGWRFEQSAADTLTASGLLVPGLSLQLVASSHRPVLQVLANSAALSSLPSAPSVDSVLEVPLVRMGISTLDETVYGETADGKILGISHSYSAARGTSNSCEGSSGLAQCGQAWDGYYHSIHRLYISLPTSSVPDGATVTSGELYLYMNNAWLDAYFDIYVYRYTWVEALCDNREANYDGAYGASATREGTLINTIDWSNGSYCHMTVSGSRINKTGDTKYTVVSREDVDDSSPLGNERVEFATAEASGTSMDPYLVVYWYIQQTDSQPCYICGESPIESAQAAFIHGVGTSVDAQHAFLHGADGCTDAQAAFIYGAASVVSALPSYVYGLGTLVDSQACYISTVLHWLFPNEWGLGPAGEEDKLSECDGAISCSEKVIGSQQRTASASLVRDVVASKRTWHVEYSWLPGKQHNVFDRGMGRDELRALLTSGAELSLRIPAGSRAVEVVPVRFGPGSWKQKLLERDGPYGWVWSVSFELVEV